MEKQLRCEDCNTSYPEGQYRPDDGEWETKATDERWGCGCAWCGGSSLHEEEIDVTDD